MEINCLLHYGCHLALYISGTRFKEYCFNISKYILYSVFYHSSCKPRDIIAFLEGDNVLFQNWYLLGVEMISSHTHKTGSWYLSEVLFKISDEHACPFYMGDFWVTVVQGLPYLLVNRVLESFRSP